MNECPVPNYSASTVIGSWPTLSPMCPAPFTLTVFHYIINYIISYINILTCIAKTKEVFF